MLTEHASVGLPTFRKRTYNCSLTTKNMEELQDLHMKSKLLVQASLAMQPSPSDWFWKAGVSVP